MRKGVLVWAVALFIVGFAATAFGAKNIQLKNNTQIIVTEIYLSHSGTDDWEEDILGDKVLPPGETWPLNISGSYPLWDIKMIGENGAEAVFYSIDFNRYTKITLNKDGNATGE